MLKLSKIHQKKRVSLVPEKKSILPLPLVTITYLAEENGCKYAVSSSMSIMQCSGKIPSPVSWISCISERQHCITIVV